MISYLDFEGTYDPEKRFIFTNWSDEDFTHTIDGRPVTIKAHDMREFGHFEAYLLCKYFVTREMLKMADGIPTKPYEESKEKQAATFAINNPDMRKPFEDKTLTEIGAGERSPLEQIIETRLRKELGMSNANLAGKNTETEFEELEEAPKKRVTKKVAA